MVDVKEREARKGATNEQEAAYMTTQRKGLLLIGHLTRYILKPMDASFPRQLGKR